MGRMGVVAVCLAMVLAGLSATSAMADEVYWEADLAEESREIDQQEARELFGSLVDEGTFSGVWAESGDNASLMNAGEDFAPARGDEMQGSARVEQNPYNCHGRTECVHKSGRMVSLHTSIVDCTRAPAYMINGAEVMKKGWGPLWHRRVFTASESKGKRRIDTHAKRVCGNYSQQTYRGNGYHRIFINGRNYTQRTTSDQETRFGCDA